MSDQIVFRGIESDSAPYSMKAKVIVLERMISGLVGNEVEMYRKKYGDRLADELLMSVVALLAARSIGMIHLWTGESTDRVRYRFIDTMDSDLTATIKKLLAHLSQPKKEKNNG